MLLGIFNESESWDGKIPTESERQRSPMQSTLEEFANTNGLFNNGIYLICMHASKHIHGKQLVKMSDKKMESFLQKFIGEPISFSQTRGGLGYWCSKRDGADVLRKYRKHLLKDINDAHRCPDCQGQGIVEVFIDVLGKPQQRCGSCNGTGKTNVIRDIPQVTEGRITKDSAGKLSRMENAFLQSLPVIHADTKKREEVQEVQLSIPFCVGDKVQTKTGRPAVIHDIYMTSQTAWIDFSQCRKCSSRFQNSKCKFCPECGAPISRVDRTNQLVTEDTLARTRCGR